MKKSGIERQTLLIAMLPVIVLAVLLESYFIYVRFADLDRALFERGKLIARQLISSSEYAVFSGNLSLLQQQVDASFAQPDVNSVRIIDAKGRFLAGAGSSSGKVDLSSPRYEDGNILSLYQPITPTQIRMEEMDGGAGGFPPDLAPMGGIIIELSKHHVNREKTEMLVLNLLLTLLVLMATTMIVLRASRKIIENHLVGLPPPVAVGLK